MPLSKRRKVVNEESAVKDGLGNRVPGIPENVTRDEVHDEIADDAKPTPAVSTSSTAERRLRHSSRSEEHAGTDVEKSTVPSTPTTCVPLRSSTRVIRKTRRDYSPPESPVKKTQTVKGAKVITPSTKTKRAWELWSTEDKNVFFEALFEYGKDFDAIQTMLVQRGRRRGLPPELLKRKDQVRFLYYRTWHKIAKFITITKDIRKEAQEIYGLINYGIFRKCIKGLNERTATKLNDLINKGYTTYKVKGKKKKLKTPVCSALKKINGLLDNKDFQAYQLPEKISVELCPRNNKTWSHVQSMSHNPRIKMNVMSDRTLGAVLEYLNKKWKCQRERILASLDSSDTNSDILTIYPGKQCKLNQAISMIPQTTPRFDITLSNYMENFLSSPTTNKGKSGAVASATSSASSTTVTEEPGKCNNSDNCSESGQVNNQSVSPKVSKTMGGKSEGEEGPSVMTEMGLFLGDENASFPDEIFSSCEIKADTTSSDSKTSKGSNSESPKLTVNNPSPGKSNCDEPDPSVQEKLQLLYEASKLGWTEQTGKTVTLAQLMLMCGKDKKLYLEYEWCPKLVNNTENLTHKLANMLRRLAHLAATEFSDFSNTKSKSQASKPATCCLCGSIPSRNKVSTANKGVNTKHTRLLTTVIDSSSPHSPHTEELTTIIHTPIDGSCSSQVLQNQLPVTQQNGVFRVPMAVPLRACHTQQTHQVSQAAVNQLIRPPEHKSNFLIPRKRKKQKNKSIIVQRTLLPKAATIMPNLPSNHQQLIPTAGTTIPITQSGGIITQPFSPISLNSSLQTAQPSPPIIPVISIPDNPSPSIPVTQPVSIDTGQYITTQTVTSEGLTLQYTDTIQQSMLIAENAVSSSGLTPFISSPGKDQTCSIRHSSPPNLSTLLDMSLPAPPNGADNSTAEKLLDIALVNSNSGFPSFLQSPVKSIRPEPAIKTVSPPASPNPTLLKLGFSASEAHWLNGESQDLSLSSFLSETPTKKHTAPASYIPPHNIFSEHSQDSLVETSFQSMMNESSMDLVSKFAKLADHISSGKPDKTT